MATSLSHWLQQRKRVALNSPLTRKPLSLWSVCWWLRNKEIPADGSAISEECDWYRRTQTTDPHRDVFSGYVTPSPPHWTIYGSFSTCPYHTMAHCRSVSIVFTLAVVATLLEETSRCPSASYSFPNFLYLSVSHFLSLYNSFSSSFVLYYSPTVPIIAILLLSLFFSHFQLCVMF